MTRNLSTPPDPLLSLRSPLPTTPASNRYHRNFALMITPQTLGRLAPFSPILSMQPFRTTSSRISSLSAPHWNHILLACSLFSRSLATIWQARCKQEFASVLIVLLNVVQAPWKAGTSFCFLCNCQSLKQHVPPICQIKSHFYQISSHSLGSWFLIWEALVLNL